VVGGCGDGIHPDPDEVGKAAQVAKDIVEITGVQQAEDVTVLSPTSLAILLRRPSGDLWKTR
jgi:hypothetical protein